MKVLGAIVHRRALGEEQQVGFDGGVGGKHAFGQADDGVQLAVAQQQFFQRAFDAVAKQKTIGQHHCSAAVFFQQLFDDERHEHVGGFAGAQVGRVVAAHSIVFIATKGRVGNDAIDFVVGTPLVPANAQGVSVLDLAGHINAVQQHVGGTQQVGQLLFFNAVNQRFNGAFVVGAGMGGELVAEVVDGRSQKAAGAAGGVHDGFTPVQARVHLGCHEGGDGAWGVELARVACAAQVVEHLLVHIAQTGAGFEVVEVDGFFQLLDHGQHLRARLHVVVGIAKNLANNLVLRALAGINLVFECRKQLVVDEGHQFARGDLGLLFAVCINDVGGPVAPAKTLGQGRPVGGVVVFPFFFALVEHLEEKHPGELPEALGIAIDTIVFAHDVLDGFDGAAEVHLVVFL